MSSLWRVAHRRSARSSMSGSAGEVLTAAVGLIANFSAGNIRDEHGDADRVLVGLNGQSIGMNHQGTADQFAIISAGVPIILMSKKMPKVDNGIAFDGCYPLTLFRKRAAEGT